MRHSAFPEAPVRRLLTCALLCLCLAAPAAAQQQGRAAAEQGTPLRAQPGEQAAPGDPSWPLGAGAQAGARVTVDADKGTPGGFRVDIAPITFGAPGTPLPGQKESTPRTAAGPRVCAGLFSTVRRDLYKTRAVEFRIRASQPVAGILVLTSSNTQDRSARDRFFGSFGIGPEWKSLRLPYGALAPLPGWAADAPGQGFRPGDGVLRPDSVEDLCIGVEAGRLPQAPVVLEIDGLRFVR